MKLVSIKALKQSEKIGYSIRLSDGRVLLRAGTPLTERYIEHLKRIGILSVYIDDDVYKDIAIIPAIFEETKNIAIATIAEAFNNLDKNKKLDIDKVDKISSKIVGDVRGNCKEPISLINTYGKDEPRYLHAVNVATIVAALCIELKLSEERVKKYTLAAMLHDIKLKEMKDDEIFSHADEAHSLIRSLAGTPFCYMAVKMHHEKFDGSGGPDRKKGEKINEGARIIAVADLYDNLVYGHLGKPPMLAHKALEYINMQSSKELDPTVVAAFNRAVSIYPTGATVVLNNGERGVVTGQTPSLPSRPKIRIEAKHKPSYSINLTEHRTLFIDQVLL